MAKLDNVRRIVKEDYDPKYHDLLTPLGYVLNSFMEQTVTEMNGNLDFANLKQSIVKYRVTVNSDGTPIGNNLLKTDTISPKGFTVIRAVNVDNPTTVFPTANPVISFTTQTNSQVVKIINVNGLPANTAFDLTVIAYG